MVIMAVMVAVTTAAVVMVLTNSQNIAKGEMGAQALAAAESGAENALLLLLRDPYNFTGQNISFENKAEAQTTIPSGNFPKTLVSVGKIDIYERRVEIGLNYVDNELGVTSWKEVY